MHAWKLVLIHATTPTALQKAFKMHKNRDAALYKIKTNRCTACKLGKIAREPHSIVGHQTTVEITMCTDVGGPIYPLGTNQEKNYDTFTEIGYWYNLVIPICRKRMYYRQILPL